MNIEISCDSYGFQMVTKRFEVNGSPFILNATIRHHMDKYALQTKVLSDKFIRDLYVDDLTSGINSLKEGVTLYEFTKSCMKEACFELRKWQSNCKELIEYINEREGIVEDVIVISENLNRDKINSEKDDIKVLGVSWDVDTDEHTFDVSNIAELALKLSCTKRNIFRINAMFFDPLGLISPIVLQIKFFFKQLCNLKVEWDDAVPDDISTEWFQFINNLKREIIPRKQTCVVF